MKETIARVRQAEADEDARAKRMTVADVIPKHLKEFEAGEARQSGRQRGAASVKGARAWIGYLEKACGLMSLADVTVTDLRKLFVDIGIGSR